MRAPLIKFFAPLFFKKAGGVSAIPQSGIVARGRSPHGFNLLIFHLLIFHFLIFSSRCYYVCPYQYCFVVSVAASYAFYYFALVEVFLAFCYEDLVFFAVEGVVGVWADGGDVVFLEEDFQGGVGLV